MRKFILAAMVVSLSMVVTARADGPADDTAIKARSQGFADAWNKHDPKAMAAFFTEDGDCINPFGRVARGRAEVEKLFTDEHNGPMAGTTYTQEVSSIRYLKPDVAVVDVDAVIKGFKNKDGSAAPQFKHRVTWVAVKQGDTWMGFSARPVVYVVIPGEAKP